MLNAVEESFEKLMKEKDSIDIMIQTKDREVIDLQEKVLLFTNVTDIYFCKAFFI